MYSVHTNTIEAGHTVPCDERRHARVLCVCCAPGVVTLANTVPAAMMERGAVASRTAAAPYRRNNERYAAQHTVTDVCRTNLQQYAGGDVSGDWPAS